MYVPAASVARARRLLTPRWCKLTIARKCSICIQKHKNGGFIAKAIRLPFRGDGS